MGWLLYKKSNDDFMALCGVIRDVYHKEYKINSYVIQMVI